ncbi:hypothetical protein AAG570_007716 [Ranatra chinensis]|uniref:Uncharacterized protein n=1 Tax=Ranatra chinensis TaxID=642074 RepID=A0ABD0XUC1_9HEMI
MAISRNRFRPMISNQETTDHVGCTGENTAHRNPCPTGEQQSTAVVAPPNMSVEAASTVGKSNDKNREKKEKGVNFMRRLTSMKKSKSPPPVSYSMDNPVFEDTSSVMSQAVHVSKAKPEKYETAYRSRHKTTPGQAGHLNSGTADKARSKKNTAIQVYVPTVEDDEEECGRFYEQLLSTLMKGKVDVIREEPRSLLDSTDNSKGYRGLLYTRGIIQKSVSPFCSPLWMVLKSPDAHRNPCHWVLMDYKELNKCTGPEKYPFPRREDMLGRMNGA